MKFHGPQVPDPTKAFSPYDLEPIHDRCINCEARKKIVASQNMEFDIRLIVRLVLQVNTRKIFLKLLN